MGEVLHEYGHLMSDPAHLMAELSLMLIIDVLFLGLIWPLLKSRVSRVVDARVAAEHKVIDAEHGVTHPADQPGTGGGGGASLTLTSSSLLDTADAESLRLTHEHPDLGRAEHRDAD